MNALYTAEALSTVHKREGTVSTSEESFNVALAPQHELGGLGGGTNPEQLLAAGFAACSHSALHAVPRGKEQAQGIADAAHLLCPHSIATRGNIDVTLWVSND